MINFMIRLGFLLALGLSLANATENKWTQSGDFKYFDSNYPLKHKISFKNPDHKAPVQGGVNLLGYPERGVLENKSYRLDIEMHEGEEAKKIVEILKEKDLINRSNYSMYFTMFCSKPSVARIKDILAVLKEEKIVPEEVIQILLSKLPGKSKL